MNGLIIVVDSSVTVKWLNQIEEKLLKQADKLLTDTRNGKVSLLSPELAKYEIGNALIRKGLDEAEAADTLAALYALPIHFIPESESLAQKTYQIANQFAITYYDASFIALAQKHGARLVTDNIKHQGKARDSKVIALKDYSATKIET